MSAWRGGSLGVGVGTVVMGVDGKETEAGGGIGTREQGTGANRKQKQIPFGNDNQKGKGNNNRKCSRNNNCVYSRNNNCKCSRNNNCRRGILRRILGIFV